MSNWYRLLVFFLIVALAAGTAAAQQTGGILKGQVQDNSGAVIPGATVKLTGNGLQRATTTSADGSYTFIGLTPGRYTVTVDFTGFSPFSAAVDVSGGRLVQLPIQLSVSMEKQEVTVQAEPAPTVSTEPDNNAGALVLRGEDLAALPDDPDDLAEDLQALAGPAAGPNGGQIFIDGFSGGRLPPKESIREIRINQNPFSAEYDRLGFGRIEILTKPGTDKFRGSAFFMDSDATFNSRNPYASNKPDFQSRMFGGNLSGPISKRSSFFIDLEKRDIDDNAIINGTLVDPATLLPTPFSQAVVTPQRRTTISPRIDYQLSTNNTLVGRYTYSDSSALTGVGGFSLAQRAYNTYDHHHNLQLTETSVLGARMVNETRVQYVRSHDNQTADNSVPTINVLQSFTGGGAQVGNAYTTTDHIEVQNNSTLTFKAHTVRFGVRVRHDGTADFSPQNFGGTFTFGGGGLAPVLDANNQPVRDASGQIQMTPITSLERYRRTLLFQKMGLPADQIRALGGGATQFSIAGGQPLADVTQTDVGAFVQDDWRMKPNFTLSLGFRYETQTNIHDWKDFAPRVGFAWSPDYKNGRQGKTVVRGGFGMFYDRFDESLTLTTLRYNGINQEQFIVQNPSFFPTVPSLAALTAQLQPQNIYRRDSNLRAPYITQGAIGVERQLPWNTTIATNFTFSHGIHMLRTRNVNAPLDGTYDPTVPNSGIRPYGDIGNILLYESSGVMNQKQWMTNVNSRVNRNIAIFTYYVLGYTNSNTDGAGSTPADQYNLAGEYGRASYDTRHRFVFGGSIVGPMALRFSPFIIARSGNPFNVTIGRDVNGDTLFNDRPAFAKDLNKAGIVKTPWGAFDPNPVPGETIIPRNYGEGPGSFTVNMRLSRTFGFGPSRNAARPGDMGGFGGPGGDHGPRGGPGGYSGSHGSHGMHGGGSFFGGESSDHRYNVTVSVSARNLFNHFNPGQPIGNLSSPLFGTANSTSTGGHDYGSGANNRRIDFQLRFTF